MLLRKVIEELSTCTVFHCKKNFDIFKSVAIKNLDGGGAFSRFNLFLTIKNEVRSVSDLSQNCSFTEIVSIT